MIMRKYLSDFKNYYVNSDYSNAYSISLKTINFARDTFGGNDISLATAQNNHGLILKSKGDLDESIDQFKKSIAIQDYIKEKQGSQSISVVSVKQNLASVLKELYPDEALKVIDEVIQIRENLDVEIFNEKSFNGQMGLCQLIKSQCLRELTSFEEAKTQLEKSRLLILEQFSENSEQWINQLTSEAFLLKNFGELKESQLILVVAYDLALKNQGDSHIISIRSRHNLAVSQKENDMDKEFDELIKVNTDIMDETTSKLPGIQPIISSDADQHIEKRLMNLWEFKDKEAEKQKEFNQMTDEVKNSFKRKL